MTLENALFLLLGIFMKRILLAFGYVLFRIGEKVLCISCGISEIAD